jgi:NAD(P)-dependent dehydrogenase (short-subunit alcohol dehydrogenase family)
VNLNLKGKVAIITGSSRGIGKEVAFELAKEGAKVVLNSRSNSDIESVKMEFANNHGVSEDDIIAIAADIRNDEAVKKMVGEAVQYFGTIDILVNNAGIFEAKPFDEIPSGDYLKLYDINVVGSVRTTLAVLPYMLKKKWGRIIMMASENGPQPDPMMIHYNLTKAALINLTSSLAKAYGSSGILVNAVSPAFISTPGVEQMMKDGAEADGATVELYIKKFQEENRPNIKLGRMGTMQEVSAVVAFLCSERASYISGANFRVDGGSVGSVN